MTRCLVIGATGYVGSRLVPRLRAAGHQVRCLSRSVENARTLGPDVDVVIGTMLDAAAVRRGVTGIDVVYFLAHSLGEPEFAELDRAAADILAKAAEAAGVRQIVYLGGLRPRAGRTSRHLASRAEVGSRFLHSPVPAIALQAAMIIGSGSTSYELLRYVTERLPIVPVGGWARRRVQPIAVNDVLHYLLACLNLRRPLNGRVDIGGPEVLSYGELIQRYARIAGLPRRFLPPAPLVPAPLVARCLDLLTPISSAVATPLLESLDHDLICADSATAHRLPPPPGGPLSVDRAIRLAAVGGAPDMADLTWRDPAARAAALPGEGDPPGSGGPRYAQERVLTSRAAPEHLWQTITSVGGERGWYTLSPVWNARGLVDHLLGGVGLHRGRPGHLEPGDAVDWWRVVECDPAAMRLVLRAEVRAPGQMWLELSAAAAANGVAQLRQVLFFVPSGITGHVYWWTIAPLQTLVFDVMARNIVRIAEKEAARSGGRPRRRPSSPRTAPRRRIPATDGIQVPGQRGEQPIEVPPRPRTRSER